MRTKSYRDLVVWQKSIDLVILVYKFTKTLPKSEQFALVSQMRRAVVSISSNIAEGYSRQHLPEYLQFLSVAFASAAELETHLIICQKLNYGSRQEIEKLNDLLIEVLKMLNIMIRNLKTKR